MLYSRHYIEQTINIEKSRVYRTASPFTLVLFDPYKLTSNNSKPTKKSIKELVKIVAQETRQTDILGWWDKKRLAILLLDTLPEGGLILIDKLISKIQSNGFEFPNSPERDYFEISTFPNSGKLKRDTENNEKRKDSQGQRKGGSNQNTNLLSGLKRQTHQKVITLVECKKHYELTKRIVDIFFSVILLLILAPLFLICALLIKLDSPGPAIYRQKRVGKGGACFTFLKFRTMYHNSDEKIHENHVKNLVDKKICLSPNGRFNESSYKIVEDSRVTRFGQLLRKTSFDEAPQLINVLKGDMSLVGPRPHPLYEAELYNHWRRYRLDVKPGITGLGQIDGRYNKAYDEVYRLDLQYVKRASLLLDLKILFRTIPAVLSSKGAY